MKEDTLMNIFMEDIFFHGRCYISKRNTKIINDIKKPTMKDKVEFFVKKHI